MKERVLIFGISHDIEYAEQIEKIKSALRKGDKVGVEMTLEMLGEVMQDKNKGYLEEEFLFYKKLVETVHSAGCSIVPIESYHAFDVMQSQRFDAMFLKEIPSIKRAIAEELRIKRGADLGFMHIIKRRSITDPNIREKISPETLKHFTRLALIEKSVREKFFAEKIAKEKPRIVVCGATHADSIQRLLKRHKIDARVVYKSPHYTSKEEEFDILSRQLYRARRKQKLKKAKQRRLMIKQKRLK